MSDEKGADNSPENVSPERPRMGRPPIEINWMEMDKLIAIQATKREIAGWFNCCEDTLENKFREKYDCTFSAYYALKSSVGKISLRRKQYQTAISGNVAMQIWLGKQWLSQSEKVESKNENNNNIKVDMGMWDLKDPNAEDE